MSRFQRLRWRLARWHVFEEFLTAVLERGDVWFAPMEEIADYAQQQRLAGQFKPRVEVLPQYPDAVGPTLPR